MMMKSAALGFILLLFFGCDGKTIHHLDGGTPNVLAPDHTIGQLSSRDDYFLLARENESGSRYVTKFVVTTYSTEDTRAIRYSDSNFFELHDEWYWFRLLNGLHVPGMDDVQPVTGLRFTSIEQIYQWANNQSQLPLDLRFLGDGRLYSPKFYHFAFGPDRVFGLGSLMHIPARTEPEVRSEYWVFELEYSDHLSHAELVIFFEELMATLPSEIASKLSWVVRSPNQEILAQEMEAGQLQFHDRIMRYSELAVPGEVEVYSSGLTAGRLRIIRATDDFSAATSGDVLVVEQLPDWLPPAAGLISAVPQTPLAHINVLARNRGIPNVYVGGVLEDLSIDQLARIRAPVVIQASPPDGFVLKAIAEDQYTTWQNLRGVSPASVPVVEPETAALIVDLTTLSVNDVESLRPLIGGKAAGYLGLMAVPGTVIPDKPLAITVKAFMEHLESLMPAIRAMMDTPEFQVKTRARYLILDGPTRYDQRYTNADDRAFKEAFLSGHPAGHLVGDLVRGGGLAQVIRDRPINPSTLAEIERILGEHYDNYSVHQGLRFRSSSSVEDIEGFNGAGLYDSNTGFLYAELQTNERDRKRTVAWALKKTWSSYWRFEPFEERRMERIDHLSGNMAVLVHSRFDDDKELSNGVLTMTVLPEELESVAVMELNVQLGAVSVTNPDGSGALPEVDRVVLRRETPVLQIDRVRASTLVSPGEVLFDDGMLNQIFEQARAVTEAWLDQENRFRDPAQASRTLTLDFEFKYVAAGWPATTDGNLFPERFVLKQARTLEPGLRRVPAETQLLPIPRDLLARANRVTRQHCRHDEVNLSVLEILTNPLVAPDLGYTTVPFHAQVAVSFVVDVPVLGKTAGDQVVMDHLSLLSVERTDDAGWWITATLPAETGLTTIAFGSNGSYRLANGTAEVTGSQSACQPDLLYSTPESYLTALLQRGS